MSTTTINTFPPLHAFDSPKGWFMAIIVLLHVGFIWAVNNGLSFTKLILPPQKTVVVDVPRTPEPPPPEPRPVDVDPINLHPYIPVPPEPTPEYQEVETISGRTTPNRELPPITRVQPEPQPVIVEPAIPSRGLSEPLYPASSIRAGHSGTVMLSLEILENGRVGKVRLLQSSGYELLDKSAMREARKWRFVPGTRDGIPVVLWKQVPITFELQEKN